MFAMIYIKYALLPAAVKAFLRILVCLCVASGWWRVWRELGLGSAVCVRASCELWHIGGPSFEWTWHVALRAGDQVTVGIIHWLSEFCARKHPVSRHMI